MNMLRTTLTRFVMLTTVLGAGTVLASADTTSSDTSSSSGPQKIISVLPPDGSAGPDYSRKDVASAIINYEAASKMQEYQLNQELLYMAAPGTVWALQAGAVIGQSNTAGVALGISDKTFVYSLGRYSKSDKITLHGVEYDVSKDPYGPLQYFQKMKDFFTAGDTTQLVSVDFASILHDDNLAKETPVITQDQAQSIVNMIVDPFPYVDPNIQTKIKNDQPLTGEEMEVLGGKIASYAVTGVSTAALSDIIARRFPASGQTKSVMEVMDDHSKERFESPDWYNSLAVASEPALLREIAQMMAYNQWVAYQQFRVSEQQLALLASINAVMAKMNVNIDQMNRQMNAAQAQGKAASQELQNKINQNSSSSTTTP